MNRILLLNSEFPPLGGGASPVSYDIALKLSENGYDIDVVTSGYRNLTVYEEVNDHFRIHRVKCLRGHKEISYPHEQASYLIAAFFKALSLHKKSTFNLTYAHFIIPTGALALALKVVLKLKYIITAHGSDVLGHNSRFALLYKLLSIPWKMILKSAILVTVPSEHLKEKILKAYPKYPEEKIKMLPNIVPENLYKPLEKEKYILTISRLHKQKGIQDLFTAFARTKNTDWHIKVAGAGPYLNDLQILAQELGITKQVEFVGWIGTQEKKEQLYGHAAIYVNPSYAESFGVTTIEAMQAGCYCIATNIGVVRQLKNISTYEPGDISMLEKHLQTAFENKELALSTEHELFYNDKIQPVLLNIIQSVQ